MESWWLFEEQGYIYYLTYFYKIEVPSQLVVTNKMDNQNNTQADLVEEFS